MTAAPTQQDGLPGLVIQETDKPSRFKRATRGFAWTLFFLACLLLFTALKLPEARVKAYVVGTLSSMLSAKGVTLTAAEGRLSFFFGISYALKDVTLTFPPPEPPVRIERIVVSPSLLGLFLGRLGGSVKIENSEGWLKASGWKRGATYGADLEADSFSLARLGVLQLASGYKGGMTISGEASFRGDPATPADWRAAMQLRLSKIVMENQPIMGFSIPRIAASEGAIDLEAEQGNVQVKSLSIGKAGSTTDDLTANITGAIALGKQVESSTLDLVARFTISPTITKAFFLLEGLLKSGKQADGSYAYKVSGPITLPIPSPVTAQ